MTLDEEKIEIIKPTSTDLTRGYLGTSQDTCFMKNTGITSTAHTLPNAATASTMGSSYGSSLAHAGHLSATELFSEKLSPILGQQTELLKGISGTAYTTVGGLHAKASIANELYSPIGSAVGLMNENLEQIGTYATTSGVLSQNTSYNLIGDPIRSTLNIASDTISTNQYFAGSALATVSTNPELSLGATAHIGRLTTFNEAALDIAGTSFLNFKTTDQKVEDVQADVKKLSSDLSSLKEQKKKIDLSEAEEQIAIMLDDIDEELGLKFCGAIKTIESGHEDFVAQSSESLTRVLEKLPFCIGAVKEDGVKKEDQIKKGLAKYLAVSEDHYLVVQQPAFYSTLGGIRHGNKEIYSLYNDDHRRYKVLVLQIEGYIYSILTYGK